MKIVRVKRRADGGASALLVHGNDLCGAFYRPLAERLADRGVEVSLATLAGFHREPPYDEPCWQRYAADIAEAVVRMDGAPRVLIGHSMGGLMAMLAAARLGTQLGHLVLIEPAIQPRRFMARSGSKAYLNQVVRADREDFVNSNGFVRRVHDMERYPAEMIELYLEVRRTSHLPTREALFTELPDIYPLPFADVVAPVLLLSGANVGVRGRLLARMICRSFARVTHHRIPKAAHWVVNEQDEPLAERIAQALC